ncbi:hypothetical protein IJI94_01335 [Candidatus Saccharibacteria bacterium]|nr:hypothetical protein [Candidatus Saccharibacteria bacterium]
MNKSDKYLRVATIAGAVCIFTAGVLIILLLPISSGMAPLRPVYKVFFITLCVVHLLALSTFITCKIRMVSIEKKELKELAMAMRKRHREQTKAKIFGKR